MVGIPEFRAEGVSKVQGGLFPKQIWSAFMDPAHTLEPLLDWDAPQPPERANARLILPGNECAGRVVGFEPGEPIEVEIDPEAPATTLAPGELEVPPETTPGRPIVVAVDIGTTIAPDNLDRNAPLPTVEIGLSVGRCR